MSRPTLRNDPDRRMDLVVGYGDDRFYFPEADLPQLNREHLGRWIERLKEAEASARRLRYRLEALSVEVERKCWTCRGPVVGRADRVYCSDACRQRGHRGKSRVQS